MTTRIWRIRDGSHGSQRSALSVLPVEFRSSHTDPSGSQNPNRPTILRIRFQECSTHISPVQGTPRTSLAEHHILPFKSAIILSFTVAIASLAPNVRDMREHRRNWRPLPKDDVRTAPRSDFEISKRHAPQRIF